MMHSEICFSWCYNNLYSRASISRQQIWFYAVNKRRFYSFEDKSFFHHLCAIPISIKSVLNISYLFVISMSPLLYKIKYICRNKHCNITVIISSITRLIFCIHAILLNWSALNCDKFRYFCKVTYIMQMIFDIYKGIKDMLWHEECIPSYMMMKNSKKAVCS